MAASSSPQARTLAGHGLEQLLDAIQITVLREAVGEAELGFIRCTPGRALAITCE
jgi:hypothetical protein